MAELKETLINAQSVAHSRQGWSGLYFAKLLERLGLVDKLKQRIIVDKGPVAAVIASGEAELGAQLLCELAPVAGIDIVGPLPDEVQGTVAFSGAVMAASDITSPFTNWIVPGTPVPFPLPATNRTDPPSPSPPVIEPA